MTPSSSSGSMPSRSRKQTVLAAVRRLPICSAEVEAGYRVPLSRSYPRSSLLAVPAAVAAVRARDPQAAAAVRLDPRPWPFGCTRIAAIGAMRCNGAILSRHYLFKRSSSTTETQRRSLSCSTRATRTKPATSCTSAVMRRSKSSAAAPWRSGLWSMSLERSWSMTQAGRSSLTVP